LVGSARRLSPDYSDDVIRRYGIHERARIEGRIFDARKKKKRKEKKKKKTNIPRRMPDYPL